MESYGNVYEERFKEIGHYERIDGGEWREN